MTTELPEIIFSRLVQIWSDTWIFMLRLLQVIGLRGTTRKKSLHKKIPPTHPILSDSRTRSSPCFTECTEDIIQIYHFLWAAITAKNTRITNGLVMVYEMQ